LPQSRRRRSGRRINDAEAEIVRRIFREFTTSKSPPAIARDLNADRIAGPRGRHWSDTTIRGNTIRGTGTLHNELYAGRLIWNRQRYVEDPQTGRPNPTSAWLVSPRSPSCA
jgi:site-specific DNA recombinase